MECVVCSKPLTGRQRKYCSRKCHNKCGNTKYQNYVAQQKRGLDRKIELVRMHGAECSSCGYRRNYAALTFHHRIPEKKSFTLDMRNCSNRKWDDLLAESGKCELLCIRCHVELHNPNLYRSNLLS